MSRVSVLVPAHRAEAFVARAVRSVLAQTWADWELILVADDGLDYRAVLAGAGVSDERVRTLATAQPTSGPGAARNRALDAARGELIAPLDADDVFHPERLARLVPLALAHGMAGDNVRVVDDATGASLGTLFPEGGGVRWLGLEAYAGTSTPMTFVFRRELVDWPWEEDLAIAEDTFFNLRALEAVGPAPVLEAVLHEYRVRDGSLCHAPDSAERAERAYARALARLETDGLGLRRESSRLVVRNMLAARRRLNRAFAENLAAGRCRNFQEFIAGRPA
jgi:glycosyltransferase involved in cell wall biosynthesis